MYKRCCIPGVIVLYDGFTLRSSLRTAREDTAVGLARVAPRYEDAPVGNPSVIRLFEGVKRC